MAIKKDMTLTDNFGINVVIKDAYTRIATIEGSKSAMVAIVETWNADMSHGIMVERIAFEPLLEGRNFISQAYDHLKTLPVYAGAVDC
jgi:hypothetical protein